MKFICIHLKSDSGRTTYGVMSSYNDWNGEPVTASHSFFLTELLRWEYGFNGL
jgi:beta-glucosidase-like glycosyl hydrolase